MLSFRHNIKKSQHWRSLTHTHTCAQANEMCLVMNSWSLIMIWIPNWFSFTSFIVYTYVATVYPCVCVCVWMFPCSASASSHFGLFGFAQLHCMPFYPHSICRFFNRSTWKRIFTKPIQVSFFCFVLFCYCWCCRNNCCCCCCYFSVLNIYGSNHFCAAVCCFACDIST